MACVGAAFLLALSGCAAVQVKLGMKVYLAKTPITSIDVSQPKGPGIGPGQSSPLVVEVTQPDGKILQTEGAGKGKVLWQDLVVTPTVVTVNKKGVLSLPKDPRKSEGELPHITITVPSHPELRAELDIPLRYDYNFVSNFSGSAGSSGLNGTDGSSGTSGSPGSMDPNNPSPGGNGKTEATAQMARMAMLEETRRRCRSRLRSCREAILSSRQASQRQTTRGCTWWIPRAVR
jgi:hypothetical protein